MNINNFFRNITESMSNPFLNNPNIEKQLSTTSELSKVERVLDGVDLEFPQHHSIRANSVAAKREKLNAEVRSDHYMRQYRNIEIIPEISSAIDEIVNEALNVDVDGTAAPSITFKDGSKTAKSVQTAITEEFEKILGIVDFESNGDDLFRRWYVDGKLIGEVVYYDKSTNKGIQHVLQLSPFGFRKRIEEQTNKIFYVYEETNNSRAVKKRNTDDFYEPDQIAYADSGLTHNDIKIGYLYYAMKVANNMGMIEDSFVIYRLLRSIETRIWNVNVGRMPKSKAENYINTVISQIKNDIGYNSTTGEFEGKSDIKSMINDFVFPTRNGTESTSVNTIGGDTSFVDSLDDHEMFLKKLYVALKIPVSRLDESSTMDFTASDILQAELKFTKFVNKLRRKFSMWLLELLKLQLIATKKIEETEWKDIKKEIIVFWNNQNEIIENAQLDNIVKKAEVLSDLEDNGVIGKFFSYEWVRTNVLGMTKEEYEEEKKKIEAEKKEGLYDNEGDEEGGNFQ